MLGLRVLRVVRVEVEHVTNASHSIGECMALQDVVHVGGREIAVAHNGYYRGRGNEGAGGGGDKRSMEIWIQFQILSKHNRPHTHTLYFVLYF